MNGHQKLLALTKGGLLMTRINCYLMVTLVLIAGISAFVAAPATAQVLGHEEIYTTSYSKYPATLPNRFSATEIRNISHYLEAVHFAGKDIVFFTLSDGYHVDDRPFLYYYAPQDANGFHGRVDIGNSKELNFRIKTCVLNNTLYIFYTTASAVAGQSGYDASKIYYRMATVDYTPSQTNPAGWALTFSEQKSLSGSGSYSSIEMAVMMNGRMYIIFNYRPTAGCPTDSFFIYDRKWYYITSSDGLNFGPPTQFFKDKVLCGNEDRIHGAGTVFLAPDPENPNDLVDKLMIAYGFGTGGALYYFVFDGVNPVTTTQWVDTGLSFISSVRLMQGGVQGYQLHSTQSEPSYLSVQVFVATSPSSVYRSRIYHAEYIPAGPKGDAGSWTGWSWVNRTDCSSCDVIRSVYDQKDSEGAWAVITSFQNITSPVEGVQSLTRIYYYTGNNHWGFGGDEEQINFQYSTFTSDILASDGETRIPASEQPPEASVVIGVIEGSPPYPHNSGIVANPGLQTSTTMFGFTNDNSMSNTYTVGGYVAGWVGYSWGVPGAVGAKLQFKLTLGMKYAHGWETKNTVQTYYTLRNYTDTPPGDLAWRMVLKPEIVTNTATLKGWDGGALVYRDQGGLNVQMLHTCLITYGENSYIEFQPYYLEYPAVVIGGTSYTRTDTAGMAASPRSDDVAGWSQLTAEYLHTNASYRVTRLPVTLTSDQGVTNEVNILRTESSVDTYTPSASFSVTAEKVGLGPNFGFEAKFEWSQEIKTTTSLQEKLGFTLNIPECCNPMYSNCTGLTCVQSVEVVPAMLIPSVDDKGLPTAAAYNAPWISDEFRNNRGNGKALPWLLTYLTYPSDQILQGALGAPRPTLNKLTVKKADAIVHVDQVKPNNDRVSFSLALEGVDSDFSIAKRQLVHLRFGNYVFDSNTDAVLSRSVVGKKLILDLQAPTNPNATIRIVLSYDADKHQLNADLTADGIELSGITPYLENRGGGKVDALPFGLIIGTKYTAEANLGGHVTINPQQIICELHLQ